MKVTRSYKTAILIPPAESGSLGDEAMVSAACSELRSKSVEKIILGLPSPRTYYWPSGIDGIAPPDTLGSLLTRDRHGAAHQAGFDVRKLVALGADIIDGAYGTDYPLLMLKALHRAAHAGIHSTLAGFSLNRKVHRECAALLKGLPPEVRLCCRDPASRARVESLVNRTVFQTTDLAFLLEPVKSGEIFGKAKDWITGQRQHGNTVIGINANSHHADKVNDLVGSYVQLVELLARSGKISFAFIPHDIRYKPNDVEVLEKIHGELQPGIRERVLLIGYGVSAAEAKAVTGLLDIVITGRMHLGIASLGQSVPALCVDYQGKVEGLYGLFGLSDLSIRMDMLENPGALADWIMQKIEACPSLSRKVAAGIDAVRDLSRLNIE